MTSLRALLHDLALFEQAGDEAAQVTTLGRIARVAVAELPGSHAVRLCRLGLARARSPLERAEFHGRLGDVLLLRNHASAAHAAYARAATLFASSELRERAWGARLAAAVAQATYDEAGARAALRALSVEILASPGTAKRRWLPRARLQLGELDLHAGHAERARLAARHARSLVGLDHGADNERATATLRAQIDALEGRAEQALGHARAARALLARALAGYAAADAGDRFERLDALEAYGWLLLEATTSGGGDPHDEPQLRELFTEGTAMAARLGVPLRAVRLGLLRASAFIGRNHSEATRHLLRAADRLLHLAEPETRADMAHGEARRLRASLLQLAALLPQTMLLDELRHRLQPDPAEEDSP